MKLPRAPAIVVLLTLAMATTANAEVYDENDDDAMPGAPVPLVCGDHPRINDPDPSLRSPPGSRRCNGFIFSPVGGNPAQPPTDKFHAALDVSLSVPPGDGPFPLVVFMHGLGGRKQDGERWEPFALPEGIAFLSFTARGRGESFGDDQLADEDIESRDAQNLVKGIVEKTVFAAPSPAFAFDRKKIAVSGISYGGGQSLLLAQTARRSWPCAPDTCELVTAIPAVGWSDLIYSLAPNGRPFAQVDQPGYVFGVVKLSYVTVLFAGGGQYHPRYNGPSNASFYFRYFGAVGAGEPYQDPGSKAFVPPNAGTLTEFVRTFSLDRSAAYQDYCASGPLPIFMVHAWTDDLFTAHEMVRIRNLLDAQCGSEYPLKVYLGNSGHPRGLSTNDVDEVNFVISLIRPWLRYYLKGEGPAPELNVVSGVTHRPGEKFDPGAAFSVPEIEEMMKGRITAQFTGTVNVTYTGPPSPQDLKAEPLSDFALSPNASAFPTAGEDAVQTVGPLTGDAAVYTIDGRSLILEGASFRTLCGLGSVNIRGTVAGSDVVYAVRVWNINSAKQRYLIDRGEYRHLGSPGNLDITVPLHGNVFRIRPDDKLIVEVTNSDYPYLRPNNLPSATNITGGSLTLPTCEPGITELRVPGRLQRPALAATGTSHWSWLGILMLLGAAHLLMRLRRAAA